MAEHQQDEAARAAWAALQRHGLSINAASLRWNIARPTITKMTMGNKVDLQTVEEFARRSGEDVNRFRELFGYPPVETPESRLLRGIKEIQEETGQAFEIDTDDLALDEATPQAVERLLARIRERVLARKQREEQ